VYRLLRDEGLPHIKIGRKYLFLRSALLDFALARLETRARRYQPKPVAAVAAEDSGMVN
jgi:hypothetical protein